MPVNCGAIPSELIENEFFGHESEAFTGAASCRRGLVAEAHGGTLFLDEIDSAPLAFQTKLLRLLQNQEFRAVGSTKVSRANVRVIAAANSDLQSAIRAGRFRRDLYYRLNVVRIELPPLRKRPEDIPLLARYFVQQYARTFKKPIDGIDNEALRALAAYTWPGNVRELENVIQKAVILCPGGELAMAHIDLPCIVQLPDQSLRALKAAVVREFERNYLVQLLWAHGGNITKAAAAAGKHRRALHQLIRKYGIRVAKGPHGSNVDISIPVRDNSSPAARSIVEEGLP